MAKIKVKIENKAKAEFKIETGVTQLINSTNQAHQQLNNSTTKHQIFNQ
jgi:hypothetical protein